MPAQDSPSISATVKKHFGDFNLDVSFTARRGITALFGPSGAGKTTLINLIAGLTLPDEGEITLGDTLLFKNETHINVKPEARRIGYIFQEARLFPHLTVEQNLRYGMKRRRATCQIEWDDVTDLLSLSALLNRTPYTLSGGEKQRVAIGRALLSDPDLLLMDEPLSGLDPKRRFDLFPFIEKLRDTIQLPIIYVSHTVEEILRLADHVLMIEKGKLSASGTAEEVLNQYAVQMALRPNLFQEEDADLGTVLSAVVKEHDTANQVTILELGDNGLLIPRQRVNPGTKLRLRIEARDVALARDIPKDTSILNTLPCKIMDCLEKDPAFVHVLLELPGGHPLWARITRLSHNRLKLAKGEAIFALVKSVALETGLPHTLSH